MKIQRKSYFTWLTGAVALAMMFLGSAYGESEEERRLRPTYAEQRISAAHAVVLSQYHYEKLPFNNALSKRIYDSYLRVLDPQRVYFLEDDITEFKRHENLFDDYLRRSQLSVPFEMYERLVDRMEERFDFVEKLLKEKFDFTIDREISVKRKDAPFAKNLAELDDLWRDRIQNELISIMIADEERTLEEAKERLSRRYKTRKERLGQNSAEDVFSIFMNVVAASYDPHSAYYSAKQMENFNINMSLSLQGIGTVLRQDEDAVKVMEVVPGGPADLTGQVMVADEIIGVAQGDEGEFVDIVDMRLDKVVEMVRGKKGTVVRLQMIGNKGKGAEKEVRIVRDTVKLEKQAAKSEIREFDDERGRHKLGVITLPAFYSDFEGNRKGDKNYRSTTRDVKELLTKMLKKEKIDGLVIDLRGNGGGSLQEVIDLSALFIGSDKTIVQTRSYDGRISDQKSSKEKMLYDGPLIVMVDRLSASASEIFAGSMQDQGRAIIVGSTTFGKGTVQTMIDLSRLLAKTEKPGQTKVTIAKFYRANGESTQEMGVVPDIQLPSFYDEDEIGESTEHYVLPWDQIEPAPDYQKPKAFNALLDQLRKESMRRFKNGEKHKIYQKQVANTLKLWGIDSMSLNLETRKKELKEKEAENLKLENSLRTLYGYEPLTLEEYRNEDGSYSEMLKESETDVLLDEGLEILRDFINLATEPLNEEQKERETIQDEPLAA